MILSHKVSFRRKDSARARGSVQYKPSQPPDIRCIINTLAAIETFYVSTIRSLHVATDTCMMYGVGEVDWLTLQTGVAT